MILSLLLAVGTTVILNNTVFYANSPNINPVFIAYVKSIPGSVLAFPDKMIAMFASMQRPSNYGAVATNLPSSQGSSNNTAPSQNVNQDFVPEQPTNVPTQPSVTPAIQYTPVANGVYAGENSLTKEKSIMIKDGTQLEVKDYTLTLSDGTQKQIQLLIPVSQ